MALHDVRHSCASLLNFLEASAVDIQAIVRHADVSTTLRYYAHDNPDPVRTALNSLSEQILRRQLGRGCGGHHPVCQGETNEASKSDTSHAEHATAGQP